MQNKKTNLELRKFRPQFAGAAIGDLMKSLGGNALDSEITTRWREIVGDEYFMETYPKGLSTPDKTGARTIILRVRTPAKITMLKYETENIRKLINKYYNRELIKRVTLSAN
jgi:hypothetical protein